MLKIIIPTVDDDLNILLNNGLYHLDFTLLETMIVNLRHLWDYIIFGFVPVLDDMDMDWLMVI